MSILTISRNLVENRLKTISPLLPIAWDNIKFTAPADGSKYLRCSFLVNTPDDTCIGNAGYYRENAVFNVYVMDKLNIGTAGAFETAEAIRTLFQKRTTLQNSNVRVHVLNTPHISGAVVTTDRLVVPISIRLTIENL